MPALLIVFVCQAIWMAGGTVSLTWVSVIAFDLVGRPALATVPLFLMNLTPVFLGFPISKAGYRFGFPVVFAACAGVGLLGGGVMILAVMLQSYALLCLGAVLWGTFAASGMFYKYEAVRFASAAWTGTIVSLTQGSNLLGIGLAALMARAFVAEETVGHFTSVMTITVCGLLVVAVIWMLVPGAAAQNAPDKRNARLGAPDGSAIAIAAIAFANFFAMVVLMAATPVAMHQGHAEASHISGAISWHLAGMYAPFLLTALFARYIDSLYAGIFGIAAIAMIPVFYLSVQTAADYTGAMILLGLGWGFVQYMIIRMVLGIADDKRRTNAQALTETATSAAVASAALVAGPLFEFGGWSFLVCVTTACLVLIVGLLVVLHTRRFRLNSNFRREGEA